MNEMTWIWIAVAVAAIVLIAVAVWAVTRARRRAHLKKQLGPEYEHVVEERGDRTEAEAELAEREAGAAPDPNASPRPATDHETREARDLDGDGDVDTVETVHTPAHEAGNGAGNGHHTLLPSNEVDGLRQRWDSIQASFIDAPREAVAEADRLVSDLTDRITDRFGSERSSLEERWNRGEDVSTEHLRQSLQRYRGFFDRLLRL